MLFRSLALDGSSGYATTSGPVLNTSQSYTVSAWVNVTALSPYATVVGEAGVNMNTADLQFNPQYNAWTFIAPSADAQSAASYAYVHASSPPQLGVWTQLVGTFDARTGLMVLYVNGVSVGTTTNSSPWSAGGRLDIGASAASSVSGNLDGSIGDVQVYQSALSASEISQLYASSTV